MQANYWLVRKVPVDFKILNLQANLLLFQLKPAFQCSFRISTNFPSNPVQSFSHAQRESANAFGRISINPKRQATAGKPKHFVPRRIRDHEKQEPHLSQYVISKFFSHGTRVRPRNTGRGNKNGNSPSNIFTNYCLPDSSIFPAVCGDRLRAGASIPGASRMRAWRLGAARTVADHAEYPAERGSLTISMAAAARALRKRDQFTLVTPKL